MKKTKQMKNQNELIALLIMGIGALMICFLIGALVSKEIVPENYGSVAVAVLTDLMVMIVCSAAVKKRTQQRFLAALLMVFAFCVFRILIGFMIGGEKIRLVHCLITIAAGAVGGVLGNTKKKRRR